MDQDRFQGERAEDPVAEVQVWDRQDTVSAQNVAKRLVTRQEFLVLL